MTVESRLAQCRLIERIGGQTEYCKALGIEDASHFNGKPLGKIYNVKDGKHNGETNKQIS